MTKQEIASRLRFIADRLYVSIAASRDILALADEVAADETDDEYEMVDPIADLLGAMPPGTVITIELPRE